MTEIKVDISKFTVGDILDLGDDQLPLKQRIEILQRGLVGGDIRDVPITELPNVIAQISAEMSKAANPT